MEKTIILSIEDTKKELADVLNKSKLPVAIMLPIVKDLLSELNMIYAQELQRDREAYAESEAKGASEAEPAE